MANQTTLPQRPARTAPVNQQVWTVWSMLMYFINSIYDPFATSVAGGGAGTDKNFVFTQLSASASWSVAHLLGKFPSITIVDTGGNVLTPDILYVDVNHVTINFGAPTSGKAYCN